jgi:hypothetical protein
LAGNLVTKRVERLADKMEVRLVISMVCRRVVLRVANWEGGWDVQKES